MYKAIVMPVATEPKTSNIPPFALPNGHRFSGGRVGRYITYTEKEAYELGSRSLTHADQAALYLAGLHANIGADLRLPQEISVAAVLHYRAVHDAQGHGNWNHDAVDYDMVVPPRATAFMPEGYEAFAWLPRPKWVRKNGVMIPVAGEQRPIYAQMPPAGYGPRPTHDGLRDRRTGWALATSPDRGLVIAELAGYFSRFMDEREAIRIAKQEVSHSYRKSYGSGKAVVFRYFNFNDVSGPFGENADWNGNSNRLKHLGAFSFSKRKQ